MSKPKPSTFLIPTVSPEPPVINPPATDDVVPDPTPPPAPRRIKPAPSPSASEAADAGPLLDLLNSLPLDAISYDDCGRLINACSAAINRLSEARRLKSEQHDAGTQRVPCRTCGRPIDISRSGGFQILTERDEFFQPINRYYCSQNCLLAKNMPSHAESERIKKQRKGAPE